MFGFIRFGVSTPKIGVGDIEYNSKEIIKIIKESALNSTSLLLFPELVITGKTCGELFLNRGFLNRVKDSFTNILAETRELDTISIIGLPILYNNSIYNAAAVIQRGEVIGVVPASKNQKSLKYFSYEYGFDEILIDNKSVPFGENLLFYNPINNLKLKINLGNKNNSFENCNVVCNMDSIPYTLDGYDNYLESIKNRSYIDKNCQLIASNGFGESSAGTIYSGASAIFENGGTLSIKCDNLEYEIIYEDIDLDLINSIQKNSSYSSEDTVITIFQNEKKFELKRKIDSAPFIKKEDKYFERLLKIGAMGLATRINSINNCYSIIGLSGGIDSALSLLITIEAYKMLGLGLDKIVCVTMSGFGTSEKSYNSAISLIKSLNLTHKDIDVKELSKSVFTLIEHDEKKYDVVFENVQARARTLILMSIANQLGGIVVGTSNMSEIALGWSTYNGDHMSMYNPIGSIPKTLVKEFVLWLSNNRYKNISETLLNICNSYFSPELKPVGIEEQKSEDSIGPYELNDFFLYYFIKYGFEEKKIVFLAELAFKAKYDSKTIENRFKLFCKRFLSSQWKRDVAPLFPKLFDFSLSSRDGYIVPSENFFNF